MAILRWAILRLTVLGMLAVPAYASTILMSGGADAAADWDTSGMTFQIGGQGIGVNAFLYNGPSQGCIGDCQFGGSVGPQFVGYSYGQAFSTDMSTGNFDSRGFESHLPLHLFNKLHTSKILSLRKSPFRRICPTDQSAPIRGA